MKERLISENFVGCLLNYEQHCILQKLLTAVNDSIESRRNKGICGLVRYLEASNIYEQVVESLVLSYSKKRELAKVVRDVFSRLFFQFRY